MANKGDYISINAVNSDDKEKLVNEINTHFKPENEPKLLENLIKKVIVLLVTPIDDEATKGRLITPQVQSIRAILNKNAIAITAQTNEIPHTLDSLKTPPDSVICDSQCLEECLQILPKTQKITTFSMIFAGFKGDFTKLLNGTNIISSLKKTMKF